MPRRRVNIAHEGDPLRLGIAVVGHGERPLHRGRCRARRSAVELPAFKGVKGEPLLNGNAAVYASGHPASRDHEPTQEPMTDTVSTVDTNQAAREASGARQYGRYLEEFEVGAVYKHWPAKTVTESDDHLFCLITMNHHPLHINDVYAAESQQGRNVVVGPLVYSLMLGMSVGDVSGKAIANLATDQLTHPAPVFHGDTLFVESEVLEVTPSRSKQDRGVVKVRSDAYTQNGTLVATFRRSVLVPRRQPGPSEGVA